MASESVTRSGTLARVPRPANALPADVARRLTAAAATYEREHERARGKLKAAVLDALEHGSIRQVAAATGLSPTTVHEWSKGRDR
jgi:hypothetical protein